MPIEILTLAKGTKLGFESSTIAPNKGGGRLRKEDAFFALKVQSLLQHPSYPGPKKGEQNTANMEIWKVSLAVTSERRCPP